MQTRTNYLSPQDFTRLLEAIPTISYRKYNTEQITMLFKITYWCALRINETLKLTVQSFELERNEVFLGDTKQNIQDYAVIPPSFKPELITYLDGKEGLLFQGITYDHVYFWLKKIGKSLNLLPLTSMQSTTKEKTKTHIFRKSMAKDLLYGVHGKKAPLNVISKTLRHRGKDPLQSTQHYLKLTNDDLKAWWEDNES